MATMISGKIARTWRNTKLNSADLRLELGFIVDFVWLDEAGIVSAKAVDSGEISPGLTAFTFACSRDAMRSRRCGFIVMPATADEPFVVIEHGYEIRSYNPIN